jgi:predicted house-cleaning noncanonical NTP pyrophosphatase (MazG superfamily)
MAEAGFAPGNGQASAPEQTTATATEPVDPLSAVCASLEEQVRDGFSSLGNISESILPPGVRLNITRDELKKIILDSFGEAAVTFFSSNTWMQERLHEKYASTLRPIINSKLSEHLDSVIENIIRDAISRVGTRNTRNDVWKRPASFLAFVDCLVRQLLTYISSASSTSPSTITFELNNGADEPAPSGIKMVAIWHTGEARAGLVRGNSLVVNHFPWIGRKALDFEDGDQAAKELALGRRRLYAKAVLANLANSMSGT